MKLYVEHDGSPAKLLSVSDKVTVGEIRDALKAIALEWYFDDGTYVRAADARQLSHLVADGLATSGRSASDAVKVQTIKQGPESWQTRLVQPEQAALGLPHGSKSRALANNQALPPSSDTAKQPQPSSATPPAASSSRAAAQDLSASSLTVTLGQSQQTAAAESGHSSTAAGKAALPEPSKVVPLNRAALDQPQAAKTAASMHIADRIQTSQPHVNSASVAADVAAGKATVAGNCDKLVQAGHGSPQMPQRPVQPAVPSNSSGGISKQPAALSSTQQQQPQVSRAAKPSLAANAATAGNGQPLQQSSAQSSSKPLAAQAGLQQSVAPVGASAQGLNTNGPAEHASGYLNGHHGLPQLVHAISASSAALALSLHASHAAHLPQSKMPAASSDSVAAAKPSKLATATSIDRPTAAVVSAAASESKQAFAAASPVGALGPGQAPLAAAAATRLQSNNEAVCKGCGKAVASGRTLTVLGSRWHKDCWRCAACSVVLEGSFIPGPVNNLPYHPACYKEEFGARCAVCNKVDTDISVDGKPMHRQCFRCTACSSVIDSSYRTEAGKQTHYHLHCYKEKFAPRCVVCNKVETDITVKGRPMHEKCFKCSSCNAVISGKFTTHEELQTHYHPDCYKEKFGARCSVCQKLLSGKYAVVGKESLHYECFKCNDCHHAIEGSYQTDEPTQSHYHPRCYKEKFGARCVVCNKVDTDITLEGRPMHRLCFKCAGCHNVIDGKYSSDDAKQAHYHPNCYKEKFGARCSACNKLFSGKYTVVGGKSLHYECFLCTDCHLPIGDGKYQTHGDDKQPYHQTCYRKNFDPRCDVCSELVPQLADGHLEYCVSSFWKQKYCKKHSSDGTSRCCSCNRLKPDKQQWLALSLGRRMLCNDCSCTAVRSTSEAQPLYDNVLGFFAKMGLALRERPPMMLVDGDTLDQERKPCREGDKQAPIFHTLGLCLLRGHGHVKHVVHSQPGLSSVYRQPSLNATLRPADLSQVEYEVKGILVMYGLPWLLTGAILAHEVMHAWVAENNINCGHAEGDEMSAVGEGIAELLGFMWLEAQASPVAAATTQGTVNVPLPKSKAVDNRTWAQRVSADGRKYFLDPVTRQTTWHDPKRWQEVVAPDGFKVYLDQSAASGISSAAKIPAVPSIPVAALQNLMPDWREHVNAEGKKFYHNSRTKESLWVLPDNVKQQVMWFEKLSSYYGNQTRTNNDQVYGGGFRAAYEAFQQYGLRNVLLHVKKNNFLPGVDDVVDSSGSKNSIKSALHPAK